MPWRYGCIERGEGGEGEGEIVDPLETPPPARMTMTMSLSLLYYDIIVIDIVIVDNTTCHYRRSSQLLTWAGGLFLATKAQSSSLSYTSYVPGGGH